tara:strand:+ start:34668 stop:35348 length:681 start_codon:yes stop_codon:yes gene_type:complete
MGGTVKISIRTEDKIYNLDAYTSFIKYVALDVALLKKDKKRILDIVKEAEGYYDFKHEEQLLSPDGYGLVYIDLVKDVIISNQGYTSLEYISSFSLRRFDQKDLESMAENKISKNEEIQQIIDLYFEGLIPKTFDYYNYEKNKEESYTFKASNLKEFLLECKNIKKFTNDLNIPVNLPSNYKLYEMDSYDIEDYKKIKKQISDLGVEFSKEEEFDWENWFEYINED